jgi:hypothetical protein
MVLNIRIDNGSFYYGGNSGVNVMEDNSLKTIQFLIILVIVLIAVQAPAEIYKYIDEDGNVFYTDDVNQVPEDQRDSYEPSIESISAGTNANDAGKAKNSELESSYEDEPESLDGIDEGSENEENVALLEDQQDLDAGRQRLEALKKEIDNEYHNLVKEKAQLAEEKEKLVNREDVLRYNSRIENLNKRAEIYIQKGKQYKEQVDAYNERIIQMNAAANENKE